MLNQVNTIAVIYIAATPATVWEALVDPSLSPFYFMGNRVEAGEVGKPFRVIRPDGTRNIDGAVLARDAPRMLRVDWVLANPPGIDLPRCEVEYRLEDLGPAVRLTVTEFVDTLPPPQFREGGRNGWGLILSGLKTLLETGKPLELATQSQAAA